MEQKTKELNYHDRMLLKHQKALQKMKENPSIIGINSSIEEPKIEFRSTHLGETVEVDLVALSKNTAYYIEYKCSDCPDNEDEIKKQLRKAKRCINGKFNRKNTKMLYVRDNFKTDELRKNKFIPFNYTPTE